MPCAIPLRYGMSFVPSPPPGKLAPHQMGKRALVFILVIAGVFVDKGINSRNLNERFLVLERYKIV